MTSVFLILMVSCVVVTQGEKKIQLVQELFRHGDRAPAFPFGTHLLGDNWPMGLEQLTKIGMRQHYELGSYIRQRYAVDMGFLSQVYKVDEVEVRSTDVDRTLASAYSHLAGLYPPTDDEKFKEDINWQPIPVHTVAKRNDHLLDPEAKCDKAKQLYEEFLNSPRVREFVNKYKDIAKLVNEKLGMKEIGDIPGFPAEITNFLGALTARDIFMCMKAHRMPLPDWVTDTIYERLNHITLKLFETHYADKRQGRLRGGPLLREMCDNMQNKKEGKVDKASKLFIYSGHDSTVTAFLGALQLFNDIMPPYAACVIVEFWQEDLTNEYSVRILYKNDSNAEPYPLVQEGCEEFCPWEMFLEINDDIISPGDWFQECAVKPAEEEEEEEDEEEEDEEEYGRKRGYKHGQKRHRHQKQGAFDEL